MGKIAIDIDNRIKKTRKEMLEDKDTLLRYNLLKNKLEKEVIK